MNETVVELSRWQFALTAMYHFMFVPLTLGITFLLAIMESVYVMTGKQVYKDMTKFWGKLFGINFAIGVATGLTMEFQFGMNWSYYSHYVGDIFGAPLAIEGLMAFFLESTFIGLFFFGWDKMSKVKHLMTTWLVAFGSNFSALWILVANGWMQNPDGATFNYETMRMEMTSFADLIFNPVAQVKFVHTASAGYVTGAVFVLAISSYYLLKRKDIEFATRSFAIAAAFGLASSISVIVLGDESGYETGEVQQAKLAAIEAEYHTEEAPAAFTVVGIPNDETRTVDYALKIDLLNIYLSNFRKEVDLSQTEIYDQLLYEADNYISIIKEINSLELQGKYDKANEVKVEKELQSFNKLHSIIEDLLQSKNKRIEANDLKVENLENNTLRIVFLGGILLLLIITFMFFFAFWGLGTYMNQLYKNLTIFGAGQLPEKELVVNDNELGKVAGLVNIFVERLYHITVFTNTLNRGDYNIENKKLEEIGILGAAVLNLRDTLRKKQKEEDATKAEEKIRSWTNSGHALFGEILRQRSEGIKSLTDDIIRNLVHYLSANQGGLFLINNDEVELISAFAYDRKKIIERKFKVGDGLVGMVALEKNTIFLDEIPKDYIEIESGLGDASPKSLVIVPLSFEDEVLGVVEIASFQKIKPYEIQFVEELGRSIASTLLTVRINARTEQLLDESQKQSNELALREIEARSNLEKIKTAQELAKKREADLSGILSAVDNTLMKGEYELDGTLISVNDRHLLTMGYQLREIKGKNIEIFIPENELEGFRKIWKSVISGIPRQIEVERRTKQGDVLWLINQYTPVTNSSGEISKVLYLAHDITRYKIGSGKKQTKINENYNDNLLKAEELENEIAKRKENLEQIEQKISKLQKYQEDSINKETDTEVQKLYTEWLSSI